VEVVELAVDEEGYDGKRALVYGRTWRRHSEMRRMQLDPAVDGAPGVVDFTSAFALSSNAAFSA